MAIRPGGHCRSNAAAQNRVDWRDYGPNARNLSRGACGASGRARRKTLDPLDGGAQVGRGAIVFPVLPADRPHMPYRLLVALALGAGLRWQCGLTGLPKVVVTPSKPPLRLFQILHSSNDHNVTLIIVTARLVIRRTRPAKLRQSVLSIDPDKSL